MIIDPKITDGINHNIFNLLNIENQKCKNLDDDLDIFISQNKSFLEEKISKILITNSDDLIEQNIRDFFTHNRHKKSFKLENVIICFLILLKKNELTGPEFKEFYLPYMTKSTFKRIASSFQDEDNSIFIKKRNLKRASSKTFSLNPKFQEYLKNLLNEQLFSNSNDKIYFQLNSYRESVEPTEGMKELDFYPILNNKTSLIEQWKNVLLTIIDIRRNFQRKTDEQPTFYFYAPATHSCIAFIIGSYLYRFSPHINQYNKAKAVFEDWFLIPSSSYSDYHNDWEMEKLSMKNSNEIILIISISSSIRGGVLEFCGKNSLEFPIYNITIKSGVGDAVLKDNQDANNKLNSLVQFLEELKASSYIKKVHLFYKGPFAFFCMLGNKIKNKFIISLYQRKLRTDDFYFTLELGNEDQI